MHLWRSNFLDELEAAFAVRCCMEVHRILGNGFQEVIYQRALAVEMNKQKISYSREYEMEIFYKGESIGTRRVDFFVEGKIMVELKAIIHLEDVHLSQAGNVLVCRLISMSTAFGQDIHSQPFIFGHARDVPLALAAVGATDFAFIDWDGGWK